MGLTANKLPNGQSCGTCRFAGTHVEAGSATERALVRCLRYPPQRLGQEPVYNAAGPLHRAQADTGWPVLTWDDWCGEWRQRVSEEDLVTVDIGPSLARGYANALELQRDNSFFSRSFFAEDITFEAPNKHLHFGQGAMLNVAAPEYAEAESISVGGIVIKNRNGPVEGTYDPRTGIATRNPS